MAKKTKKKSCKHPIKDREEFGHWSNDGYDCVGTAVWVVKYRRCRKCFKKLKK